MPDLLTRRELNRATLARQLLLRRSEMTPIDAVTHLVGLQSQTTHSWYVGLWSRLADLDPVGVGTALVERQLVRIPVMRSTIHLLTAADALGLRPLTQPVIERSTMGAFGRDLVGVNQNLLVSLARKAVDEQPRTAAELGRLLAPYFPGHDPLALAQAARSWLPMVQVPPRGVWGRSGQARQAALGSWLGQAPVAAPIEDVVLRHLGAFGPATVRDVQTWCGLTRLSEVVDRLRDRLVRLTDDDGRELFDLPDAERPDPDTPAPVRFLYDFDNLLLSYADRRRLLGQVAGAEYAEHGYTAEANRAPASLLVDGFVGGTWTVARSRGEAVLNVRGFRRFSGAERDEIAAEGAALLTFLHPGDDHEVRVN